MATSTCAKCDSISFEAVTTKPTHSIYPIIFVQCSQCGTVVGVLDHKNIGHELAELDNRVKKLQGEWSASKISPTHLHTLNRHIAHVNASVDKVYELLQELTKKEPPLSDSV